MTNTATQVGAIDPNRLPDRNSPKALEQRLKRAEEMLTKSLNLIAAMQPVVSAVERYFNSYDEGLAGMGEALASYRAHIKHQTSNIKHAVQSQTRRPTDHRGSQGETDQAQPENLAAGSTGS